MWRNIENELYFCRFTKKEKVVLLIKGIGILLLFTYFFYRAIAAVLPLIPLFIIYERQAARELALRKRTVLRQQFKEVMHIVAGNLKAGYSVENAFVESNKEAGLLYGKESGVVRMLDFIIKGLENNVPLEYRMKEAGKRSGIEEIAEFAAVFSVAKLSGGNISEIMERTAVMIRERMETQKAIEVLLSARKLEQKIMNIVPFFILFYLDLTSPGFFQILYHNLFGIAVMSICLLLYLTAYGMSAKIVAIEV